MKTTHIKQVVGLTLSDICKMECSKHSYFIVKRIIRQMQSNRINQTDAKNITENGKDEWNEKKKGFKDLLLEFFSVREEQISLETMVLSWATWEDGWWDCGAQNFGTIHCTMTKQNYKKSYIQFLQRLTFALLLYLHIASFI